MLTTLLAVSPSKYKPRSRLSRIFETDFFASSVAEFSSLKNETMLSPSTLPPNTPSLSSMPISDGNRLLPMMRPKRRSNKRWSQLTRRVKRNEQRRKRKLRRSRPSSNLNSTRTLLWILKLLNTAETRREMYRDRVRLLSVHLQRRRRNWCSWGESTSRFRKVNFVRLSERLDQGRVRCYKLSSARWNEQRENSHSVEGEHSFTSHYLERELTMCFLSIAYAAQQAWMQSCSLKDNILFGQPYDEARYRQVIHDACLEADIEMLPYGDQTDIGEKVSSSRGYGMLELD